MNAIQSLGLRKPDNRNAANNQANTSDATTRFNKKSNIKEMLIRNFFRKYPLQGEISDMQQLQIERQVASELEQFVNSNNQINTKILNEFETRLARDVGLSKRPIDSRSPDMTSNKVRNLIKVTAKQSAATGANVRMSSQRNPNNRLAKGGNQQFQLP